MGFLALASHALDQVAASTITPSSESPIYPANNLKTLPLGKRTWTLDTVLDATWLFDLGSAKFISLAAVLAHNLTSAATLLLTAGSTADATELTALIPWRDANAYLLLPVAQKYRFWKLRISDAANPAGHLAFGRMLLIDAFQLGEINFSFGWRRIHMTGNLTHRTPFGVVHSEHRYQRKGFHLPFESLPKLLCEQLVNYVVALKGNSIPVFVIPDPSDYNGYLCRLEEDFEETFRHNGYRDIPGLTFLEEPPGIALT